MIFHLHELKAPHRTQISLQLIVVALIALLALAACRSDVQPEAGVQSAGGSGSATLAGGDAPAGLVEISPLDREAATAPVRLEIPEIGLDAPVTPMEWAVVTLDGERTTMWTVPLESLGWHVNSAGAGALGNTAISGHQREGAALLAPLALGSVQPGQDVRLTDSDGLVFVYRIREVSAPIPVIGATEEEKAEALAFLTSGDEARLTLITGWPEFTTTHRIFAAADFLGAVD